MTPLEGIISSPSHSPESQQEVVGVGTAVGRSRGIPGTRPGFFEVLSGSIMGLTKHLVTVALLKMEMRQDITGPQWGLCF